MRTLTATATLLAFVLVLADRAADTASVRDAAPLSRKITAAGSRAAVPPRSASHPGASPLAHDRANQAVSPGANSGRDREPGALDAVVRRYCQGCHNNRMPTGDLSLEGFDVAGAARNRETAEKSEKMIKKLRVKMMPPPGMPRPPDDTLLGLVETLEMILDESAAAHPNPGHRTFQRLNRPEYARAIRDLLAVEVNAGDYLPLDTMSANFDNMADTQLLSPTLLDGYLKAAAEISRVAVGNPDAKPAEITHTKSRTYSQWDRVDGAPQGTRGGFSVVHNFPADGDYIIKMAFQNTTTGGLSGNTTRGEKIDISIDGAPGLAFPLTASNALA